MASPIPAQIHNQRYIDLATTRKSGAVVHTPVWFAENDDKLFVMTNPSTGKYKRIRNNPNVSVAPCTIRGKITGPAFSAVARILPAAEGAQARALIRAKYWLARVPLIWRKSNVYLEISF